VVDGVLRLDEGGRIGADLAAWGKVIQQRDGGGSLKLLLSECLVGQADFSR